MTIIDQIKTKLPARFSKGQGLLGPEFYGCFGTGTRPCIMRSPYRQSPTHYLVGPELALDDVKFQAASDRLAGKNKNVYRNEYGRKVFVCQTRTTAVKKFLALCVEAADRNNRMAKEHAAVKAAAAKGDVNAAAALIDY